jgi:signal transduction histidine kinase
MSWITARIPDRRQRIGSLICLLAFALSAVIAALSSRAADWEPLDLVVVLLACAIASELMVLRLDRTSYPGWIITSSAPTALAMTLLGPAPALVIGTVSLLFDAGRRRPPLPHVASNLANYGTFMVSGALLARWISDGLSLRPEDAGFIALVLGVYAFTVGASFLLNALTGRFLFGDLVMDQFRAELPTSLRAETPISFLTAGTAYAYGAIGIEALGLLAVVQFTFQYLAYNLILSRQRADSLQLYADELAEMHSALQEQAGRLSELSASRGRLVGQVLQAEEVERRRLAEALHDEALQELLAARQGLAPIDDPRAERARDSVARAVDQLREAIFDLHPAVLEHAGLAAALGEIADHQAARAGFRAEVDVDPEACGDHDSLLFVLGREQLVNAAKHSGATDVGLVISRDNGRVVMEVSDNGCGMDAEGRRKALRQGHIGLASSAERVEALGGELEIDSSPGRGTRIRTTLPLAEI